MVNCLILDTDDPTMILTMKFNNLHKFFIVLISIFLLEYENYMHLQKIHIRTPCLKRFQLYLEIFKQ